MNFYFICRMNLYYQVLSSQNLVDIELDSIYFFASRFFRDRLMQKSNKKDQARPADASRTGL